MRVEKSIVIHRPVDEVFAFLTDVEGLPRWVGEMVEARKTSDGPLGVGATWRGVASFLGRRMESDHVVTAFDPGRRYAYETVNAPVPGRLDYRFEPVEAGTRVTFTGEVEPGGAFRLAGPLLARAGRRMYETNLAALKGILEAKS